MTKFHWVAVQHQISHPEKKVALNQASTIIKLPTYKFPLLALLLSPYLPAPSSMGVQRKTRKFAQRKRVIKSHDNRMSDFHLYMIFLHTNFCQN